MAYLVFARKWRPMSFDDVVGQEHITNTIKRSISADKVAHSYIFTGTRGVGKTTTARILARALNCEKGPTPEPCGECGSCKAAISGSNFNVVEFDAASNSGVNDVKELMESVNYVPVGNTGNSRVFLIDEAHSLSKQAWNSLLKTLEEPPSNVVFIFATTEPEKIPQTILSRSIRFDFRPIGEEAIFKQLAKICDTELIKFEENTLRLIARKANGSMRDSLSLLEQVRSYCEGDLKERQAREVLGLISVDTYVKILEFADQRKIPEILEIFDNSLNDGYDISEFIDGLTEFLRSLLFFSIKGNMPEDDLANSCKSLLEKYSEGDIIRISEMAAMTQKELYYSSFRRFAAERLLVKIANIDKTVTISQLLDFFKKSENSGVQQPERLETAKFENDVKPIESKIVEKQPQIVTNERDFHIKKTETKEIVKNLEPKVNENIETIMQKQPIIGRIIEKFDGKFID
ncbi:MAG: DNA polymerase III subunit gamma/tau [Chitinispirillales bacterium]|jgi:DNA polymerase-3 subunit gamma/tau|nr:DNA polymerase III subunit gamma/tau [Chitinispirillales bacterium]